jgi:hypothetical protein
VATREDCLSALEDAASRLGESPTKAQYEELDITPAASTILRHCGSWNDAKAQAGLSTNQSTGPRVEPKPDDVSVPDGETWSSLSQDQRWHYRNRDRNAQRSRDRRRRLREWLHQYRTDKSGCVRCAESSPFCLDFHHADDTRKRLSVNEMVASGYSRETIRTEIEDCQLLCANCHWREHNDAPAVLSQLDTAGLADSPEDALEARLLGERPESVDKESWVRAWSYAYQQVRGCQRCGEGDPVCLQFHHPDDEKMAAVGEMITNSRPIEAVHAEIEKTTVLCANCHRTEHHPATPASLD